MSAPDDSPQPIRRRPVFVLLGQVFLGLLLGLVLADVGVGYYDAQRDLQDDGLHMEDAELRWTNRPGFANEKTRINSFGLRSPELPDVPPPDEVRVLGVGASRIYGAGHGGPTMDETWAVALQDYCDRELEGPWRILNGGVMGYSAVQASRRAIRLLPQLEPDLVLVFTAPGAQVMLDLTAGKEWLRVEGELLPADIADALPSALWPAAVRVHQLLRRSHLYTRYRAQFQGGETDPSIAKFVLSRQPLSAKVEELLGRTRDELVVLRDACAERGVELRVVVLPQAFQDSERAWRRYLEKYGQNGAPPVGTPRREPDEVLLGMLAELGLRTWYFAPEVDVIGSDRKRYTCDNAHWSPEGHALIGRGVAARLAEEHLDQRLRAARLAAPRR